MLNCNSKNIITFKLPKPYNHKFELILTPYKGELYLLSEYEIKDMKKKKSEYWYTRVFKKIKEKTLNEVTPLDQNSAPRKSGK